LLHTERTLAAYINGSNACQQQIQKLPKDKVKLDNKIKLQNTENATRMHTMSELT